MSKPSKRSSKLKAWYPLLVVVFVGLIYGIVEWAFFADVFWGIGSIILGVALVFLVTFVVLLPKILSTTRPLKWSPPFLFLFGLAWLTCLIIFLIMRVNSGEAAQSGAAQAGSAPSGLTQFGLLTLTLTLVVTFGLPWLLPTAWVKLEVWYWKSLLDESPAADRLRNYARRDFELLIREKETDEGLQRPFAALLAVNTRLVEFREHYDEFKKLADEKKQQILKRAIKGLNEGWRSGIHPEILKGSGSHKGYMDIIEESSEGKDVQERLPGLCAVANVRYLLGDLKRAEECANSNWNTVEQVARSTTNGSVLRWMASYAYFNTKSFVRLDFPEAMEGMTKQYGNQAERERIRAKLSDGSAVDPILLGAPSDVLTVDPFLSIPRNLILAAAFNESPLYNEQHHWPSAAKYGRFRREFGDRTWDRRELFWAESWYKEAKRICGDEHNDENPIARDFSYAYAGFYFILLWLHSSQAADENGSLPDGIEHRTELLLCEPREEDGSPVVRRAREVAREVFQSAVFKGIREESPPNDREKEEQTAMVSRYVRSGFYGIYKLVVEDDPEKALGYLRKAAQFSDMSGNRFAIVDCLFACCHAVAAQRVEQRDQQYLEPEVEYYRKKAKDLAKDYRKAYREAAEPVAGGDTDTPLYSRLCERVDSEVKRMREEGGRAETDEKKLERSIENLNKGWRAGMPRDVLLGGEKVEGYVEVIDKLTNKLHSTTGDTRKVLSNRCTVASIKYLLGQLNESHDLAREVWGRAGDDRVLKWMASYAYFNSTWFLGEFETAMELMAEHWSNRSNYYTAGNLVERQIIEHRIEHWSDYYALGNLERRQINSRRSQIVSEPLFKNLPVNPVLSIPRHLILAAAFNGSPLYEKQCWPDGVYGQLQPDERESELKWVECWYKEAIRVCDEEEDNQIRIVSRDFSHAYAGFYFTLLCLDNQHADTRAGLPVRAKRAFESITEEESSVVTRYVKWGFYGIYKLAVEDDPTKALEYLRKAAQFSDMSGNRFAIIDCLFMCCRAVAAQRVDQEGESYLEPEVDYYLKKAKEIAEEIEKSNMSRGRTRSGFYFDLYETACSEIVKMRGKKGLGERLNARSSVGRAGKRILRVLRNESNATTVR